MVRVPPRAKKYLGVMVAEKKDSGERRRSIILWARQDSRRLSHSLMVMPEKKGQARTLPVTGTNEQWRENGGGHNMAKMRTHLENNDIIINPQYPPLIVLVVCADGYYGEG